MSLSGPKGSLHATHGHPMGSPFLDIPASQWIASNELAFAIRDRYPVSPGHTLIIPKRLVATWFEASRQEQVAIPGPDRRGPRPARAGATSTRWVQRRVQRRQGGWPDRCAPARPRDPTIRRRHGGSQGRRSPRHSLAGQLPVPAHQALATGGTEDPFLRHIEPALSRAERIAIVAAFVQDSGLELLWPWIDSSLGRGAEVQILTGDYLAITQVEALQRLLDWENAERARERDDAGVRGSLRTRIIESGRLPGGARAFHPKSWRFEGPGFGVHSSGAATCPAPRSSRESSGT